LAEFAHLQTKQQQELMLPAMRGPSRLLPLLPESTVAYVALPNYGDTLHQALQVFHQELQESAVLRDWWQHVDDGATDSGASGRKVKIEDALEKLYQFSQYLGDEIVLSTAMKDPDKNGLIMAEIRKPGLQAFLQQLDKDLSGKSSPSLRVFDPQQLATAKDEHTSHEPIVLVRSDYVVIGFDLSTLRSFNAQLDGGGGRFASTAFGQRLAQTYQGGADTLLGADLQQLLTLIPKGAQKDQLLFQRSGFADLKYLIWEHKDSDGLLASEGELSFTGPRHGIASWLASSAPLGSLDFVSPKATMVEAFLLKSPAQIFEEVKDLVGSDKPGAFASLEQAEQGFQMSLKEDLLRKLSGEVAIELDGPMQPTPAQPIPSFKLILGVKDQEGLQQTLNRLLATTGVEAKRHEEGGLTYYAIPIPSAQKPVEAAYAFLKGYLIIASSPELLIEADRIHRTGESLAKSKEFRASLPRGHSADASAVFYEDLGAAISPMLNQLSPELAQFLPQLTGDNPIVMFAYGDETTLRSASNSGKFDLGVVLVTAAIAIPNLMRSRTAANEAAAAATMRTVNTAQLTYSMTYKKRGYAPDLATLGPGSSGDCNANAISDERACLLNAVVGGASCTSGTWCTKSGFQYSVIGTCRKQATTGKQSCMDYVVVATPASPDAGGRSFCSTSDAMVRFKTGTPLKAPVSVAICQSWAPL
jgi:type II secretory pathway pseudopilin PulG